MQAHLEGPSTQAGSSLGRGGGARDGAPWGEGRSPGHAQRGWAYSPLAKHTPRPAQCCPLAGSDKGCSWGRGAGENGGNGVPGDPQGTMLEEGEKPMLTAGREGGEADGRGWEGWGVGGLVSVLLPVCRP